MVLQLYKTLESTWDVIESLIILGVANAKFSSLKLLIYELVYLP